MEQLYCKLGDLAIVVTAFHKQNIGQIVELIGVDTKAKFAGGLKSHVWSVKTASGRKTMHYSKKEILSVESKGPVPDYCLRPVSGLDDPDSLQEAKDRPLAVTDQRTALAV